MKDHDTAAAIVRAHAATPAEEALRAHVKMLEGEIERLRGIIEDLMASGDYGDDDDDYGRGFDAGVRAAHSDGAHAVELCRNDAANAYRHLMDAQEAAARWRTVARWFGVLTLAACVVAMMRGAQ